KKLVRPNQSIGFQVSVLLVQVASRAEDPKIWAEKLLGQQLPQFIRLPSTNAPLTLDDAEVGGENRLNISVGNDNAVESVSWGSSDQVSHQDKRANEINVVTKDGIHDSIKTFDRISEDEIDREILAEELLG
ncbi:hypothetical protein LTR66_017521, partial [Elasticomyces elasticus]